MISETETSKLPFVDLPSSDKLIEAANSDDVQGLIDEVISTGVLGIHCFKLPNSRQYTDQMLTDLNLQLARELVKHRSDESVDGMKFETTVKPYSPKLITKTARIVSVEVNVFTDKGGVETRRIGKSLRKALTCLPLNESTTKVVSSRAVYNDEDTDGDRHLTVSLYLNLHTGRAMAFYLVEGRM